MKKVLMFLGILFLVLGQSLDAGYVDYVTGEAVTDSERMCMRAYEYAYEGTNIILGEYNYETQKFETRYLADDRSSNVLTYMADDVAREHGYSKMTYCQIINGYIRIIVNPRDDTGVEYLYQENPDGTFSVSTIYKQSGPDIEPSSPQKQS